MSETKIECPTPSCVAWRTKYPQYPPRVYESKGLLSAECCGGLSTDGGKTWRHNCQNCRAPAVPGTLTSLLSGHFCAACYERKRKTDRKCGMCRKPMVDCYC